MAITTSFDIKIALLGHVSVGKTTLLNALLCGKFSEVSKKRTTAGVNNFRIVSNDLPGGGEKCQSATETLEKIVAENQRLRGEEKIEEQTFDIQFEDEVLFQSSIPGSQIRFILSDFPGMNEAKTSQLYRDFVQHAWDTFDCAIVVMDACQGVNTQEQVDLLKFVKSCNEAKKDIPIVILCNKVDDEMDSELMSLVHEVQKEVETLFNVSDRKEALEAMLNGDPVNPMSPIFMHISAENAFVYRSASKLSKDNLHTLEKTYFDKIGHEEVGKVKWNRLSSEEKYHMVLTVVSDPEQYKDRLQSSNFDKLIKVLQHIMGGQENQQTVIEKQIQVILKRLSASTDFMKSLSDLCNLQMTIKKSVDGIVEKFWSLFDTCKAKAVESFKQWPWKVTELAHPMKQLIAFHNFLKSNQRFKESMTATSWTEQVQKAKESMIDLICEQLSIICCKLATHKDCGKCDPWVATEFSSHSHSDRSAALQKSHITQTETSIWTKAGSSDLKIRITHPDPSSNPSSKNQDKWEGLSRREKYVICHSILIFKHDKVFCHAFNDQIIQLEILLKEAPSVCKCNENQINISNGSHWSGLIWQCSQSVWDDETISLSSEMQAKRAKLDKEYANPNEAIVSVDPLQVTSNGAVQNASNGAVQNTSNDDTVSYNLCDDDADDDDSEEF